MSVASVSGFDGEWLIGKVGIMGFVLGLLYGSFYVYKHRWVLGFPIIQVEKFTTFSLILLLLGVSMFCWFQK